VDFPQQYQTRVGERGITLSGGQKQRVSIARAIMKKPRLLIFDDCLSAVDTETEEKILQQLRKLIKQRTSIIISHRVSSVKNANHILVLDKGCIVEQGQHAELMAHQGEYHELYQQQLTEQKPKAV
jgi:ATP-binding cassette subfamily B protein